MVYNLDKQFTRQTLDPNQHELDIFDVSENCKEIIENKLTPPDIPVQFKESLVHVSNDMNWTIGVLVDENWKIISHPWVKKAILSLNEVITEETLDSYLKYQSWDWIPMYNYAYNKLIEAEEKKYWWWKPQWCETKSYFIHWWWNGLAIFRDFFLKHWDTMILPNYRWPNIDWIVKNKTGRSPSIANIFDSNWKIDFKDISRCIDNARFSWEKKVGIYLNFPHNPTWTNASEEDMKEFNKILANHSDMEINIVVDDPYWAYACDENAQVKQPISYMINTKDNKHVTVLELWSHWTKEAWVYWLRSAVMRGITHKDNKETLEKKLWLAIRETTSMSPTITQDIMIRAILGIETDVFSPIESLNENQVDQNIKEYLEEREKILKNVIKRVKLFQKALWKYNSEYLQCMSIEDGWIDWFYLTYSLSEIAKEKWMSIEQLRRKCINSWDNSISFAVFQDDNTSEQCLRISLISWDFEEYAKRLRMWIENQILDNWKKSR